jgi:hypothetical protein
MNTYSRGFVVPLVIIIIALVGIGGGTYYYSKAVAGPKKVTRAPTNFVTYTSPLGFTIKHPPDWKTKEIKGVDASLGGALLMSPGTNVTYKYYSPETLSDSLEHLVEINAGAALGIVSLDSFRTHNKQFFTSNDQYMERRLLDDRMTSFSGTRAYVAIYTETNKRTNTTLQHMKVTMLLNTKGVQDENLARLGGYVELHYIARPEVFDQKLAESIINTFSENMLKTLEKKVQAQRATEPPGEPVRPAQVTIPGPSIKLIPPAPPVVDHSAFATCVKGKGAVMYGASWSPHTTRQKALFGKAYPIIPYVECAVSGTEITADCSKKNIEAFPTWHFVGKGYVQGDLSLEAIAQHTGCTVTQ